MKDPDPLNLRPDDPMVKWRRDANRAEEERRAAQRELRQSREHDTVAHLRADMQHEIANLRTEMNRLHELQLAAVGQALGEISNKICERAEKAVDKIESDRISTSFDYHPIILRRRRSVILAPQATKTSTFPCN